MREGANSLHIPVLLKLEIEIQDIILNCAIL